MDKIGVIHGRFQILHNDHMKYLLAGKTKCEYLVVGIANPDITLTKFTKSCPDRSAITANPLTYYERFQMLLGALLEAGITRNEFDIVPFPINYPELLFNYVPKDAKYYMTIYDEWGREKFNSLKSLGCDIDVLWEKNIVMKGINSTYIRNLIINGKPWEHLVPNYVYYYILNNHIDIRMRSVTADC